MFWNNNHIIKLWPKHHIWCGTGQNIFHKSLMFLSFLCVISFFWYPQATQLFLIGCLLTLKCFLFNLTSLPTDLLPGPATSISLLHGLSSSSCTNSWTKISQNNLWPCQTLIDTWNLNNKFLQRVICKFFVLI